MSTLVISTRKTLLQFAYYTQLNDKIPILISRGFTYVKIADYTVNTYYQGICSLTKMAVKHVRKSTIIAEKVFQPSNDGIYSYEIR